MQKKKQNDKHKRNVNQNKQALEESCALFPNLKRLCGSQAELITKEAIKLRNEGKYFDSLHKFNEALTNAPSFYESSSIYAERAAVYYSLKQFKHFRNNIRLAIDNNHPYPAKLRKWEKAAGKLDPAADEQHPADDFFKLSHPPNEEIPFVADCLELKEDAIFRYRLTTSKHLKVGDVIALDKPFSKMVQIDSRYQQCGNCLKQNRLDLIPCRCKFIMFCSEKCKDEASNGFHALECQDINGVMLTEDLLWFHLAMKTLTEAVSLFDDDPNDLKVFLSEKLCSSQKMQKVFESLMGFSANNLLKAKNLLKNSKLLPQAATLWSFDWTDDSFVEYKRLLVANALDAKLNVEYRHNKGMHRLVERFTADFKQFDRIIKRSECKDFGTEFILKHSNNLYVKSEKSEDGYWTWNGGLYFMRNFMTFGCMPNVKGFIKDGGDMVLIVTAPIVANGTLFIDYEMDFLVDSKKKRIKHLLDTYDFKYDCPCKACKKNFETFDRLGVVDEEMMKKAEGWLGTAKDLDVATSMKIYKENCAYIEKNFAQNYPCKELAALGRANDVLIGNILKNVDAWKAKK